jgi:hypothetical protein
MRLLQLQDGSWLAATSIYGSGSNTYINVRRSTDGLHTWTLLTSISESGRNLDNPILVQLPNGNVLLSNRSVLDSTSTRIEVWTAANVLQGNPNPFSLNSQFVDDVENPTATTCPFNSGIRAMCGVWEPNLVIRNGSVLVFYSDESMQQQGYNQVISEKVSTDGGQTWGAKSVVASKADSVSRPGMPYVTLMQNGQYMMSYEVGTSASGNSGSYSYPGSYKTSSDGVTWQAGLGSTLPASNSNAIVQSFSNAMLIMTSGNHDSYYSADYGNTWSPMNPATTNGTWAWQSLYQTGPSEIALVDGPAIILGNMAPLPWHSLSVERVSK